MLAKLYAVIFHFHLTKTIVNVPFVHDCDNFLNSIAALRSPRRFYLFDSGFVFDHAGPDVVFGALCLAGLPSPETEFCHITDILSAVVNGGQLISCIDGKSITAD
ncbi:hypothetical protein PoB_001848300 [Plakobranchus ocellatus]|uniref:Uncharacterized protein n=1 Tax=Plakobranchus ocellatus TaxID=259542 RepID=A0AAV3ZBK2_9GAST|nr:hypothetical protein PoB_001848300 [Plakobranchus ocellatus]